MRFIESFHFILNLKLSACIRKHLDLCTIEISKSILCYQRCSGWCWLKRLHWHLGTACGMLLCELGVCAIIAVELLVFEVEAYLSELAIDQWIYSALHVRRLYQILSLFITENVIIWRCDCRHGWYGLPWLYHGTRVGVLESQVVKEVASCCCLLMIVIKQL